MKALRWVVGVVVLLESLRFALAHSSDHHLAAMGLPLWLGPALGGIEALAAVLFLVPRTSRTGGVLLIVIFAFAALVHVLHGQYDVGGLVVYGAAVAACLSPRASR